MTATLPTSNDILTADLVKLGFELPEPQEEIPRIVASASAAEKSGKSHWGIMTWPDPLAVISLDTGTLPIVQKARRAGRVVIYNKFKEPEAVFTDEGKVKVVAGSERNAYEKEWDRLKDCFKVLVSNRKIRTLVVDTGTQMWELLRMARHGKLTQVMPQHYTATNAEMREVVTSVFERLDLNALFLHKMKKQYKARGDKEVWTGAWERAGFGDMPYLVDMNLEPYFNHDTMRFGIRVLDCPRSNPAVIGQEFEDAADGTKMGAFPWLAVTCYPDTTLEHWGWRG